MSDLVTLEVEGGIATLRLNRPPMNALSAEVGQRLMELSREVSERADVYGVVVYGGEKVFAAGADVKEMATKSYAEMADYSQLLQDFTRAVARIPKPTVAAITGYALGGGLELALACDFRVAAKNAKVGQPEILLGVIPGAGGTQRLSRLIGPAKAKDLVFSGRFVSADEALAIGLVDEVVEADEVYAASRARLEPYVGGASVAIRAAKDAIDRGLEVDLETGLEIERMLFHSLFATEDREIGMKSFVENGPGKAKFEGR
ncbi:enoyl-CoA hydratase/isomerase family protein [Knoellia koreensis]|uniref:enoyl-CoA hydratase n=1 Tax=Knoellia koreensis TaxID=2730921 RepID=A0A849HNQ7_9MICO|nr:enoyl-CoA hydratase-related protein [Knoellia sp. DB2414S]NNM46247.1 enoyl-CoA hydratase/isomerase family protein [Knoellia sp. DB2414S]